MNTILVDIDNTLLSQNRRKQKILFDLFSIEISIQEISKDFSLERTLEKIADKKKLAYNDAKNMFEEKFFSNLYYDELDLFDVIGNSNNILTELCRQNAFEVIYLTSRNPALLAYTKAQLIAKNYPYADDDHIVFAEVTSDKLDNYSDNSFAAKEAAIGSLCKTHQIIAHIGDLASDAAASYFHEVTSIVLSSSENNIIESVSKLIKINTSEIDPYGILCIPDWADIKDYLLNRTGQSSSIADSCKVHAENYASWMSDLDQKSSLILVIATFSSSIFFSILTDDGIPPIKLIFAGIGFIFALISMYSAISSFSSRVTHGNESILKVLFSVLTRNYKSSTFSPIHESNTAAKTKFPENIGAKYIYRRFQTFNEDTFSAKNMVNLRAANYQKIYPEYLAKVLLIASIILLFLIAFSGFFPSSHTDYADQISVTVMQNHQADIPHIYSFDSTDFDFESFTLSTNGKSKLDTIAGIYAQQPFDSLYISFSPDATNNLSEFLTVKRDELQLSIIYEALSDKMIDVKVVLIRNVPSK